MLSSRQRAYLRAMANSMDTIFQIGKGGITDAVVAQVAGALEARELIKGRVLESSGLSASKACDELCRRCGAEPVQVIGSRFVIYRESGSLPREKKINLGTR